MAVWNAFVPPAPLPVPYNPGRSLLPSDAWNRLSEALRLSRREAQIVEGVFEDQKEEAIAYELGISPHTVNTYFQRLYAKLQVSSRPQLIVRIMAEYLTMARDRSFSGLVDESAEWPHGGRGDILESHSGRL
jgi:DNA-binding CsgD family transcriptional regulator